MLGETEFFSTDDMTWLEALPAGVVLRIVNTANGPLPDVLLNSVVTRDHPWPLTWGAAPTIGLDRCLAVIGARSIHPHGEIAVISCGTCLTGTLLDATNTLRGGPISPGWNMRLQAMADGAPALPRLTPEIAALTPAGTPSTEASMRQGAYHGMLVEMQSWMSSWRQEYPKVAIYLTGGDGLAFAKPLESGIFAASNLEALGILAQYNYEKNH